MILSKLFNCTVSMGAWTLSSLDKKDIIPSFVMKDIQEEAQRIGEQLLTSAKHNEHGTYWQTADLDMQTKEITWHTSEGIYNGVAGIALFYLELFRSTGEKKYLATCENAMKWVDWYCKKNPTSYYALFTGRLGVSFVYLRLYEVTKRKIYLSKALAIAKKSLSYLEERHSVNDLINGFSGALLGLMHLHAATQEEWLLTYIQKYVTRLLENARFGEIGLYWDTNYTEIHPLCGFSHGSGGIGFVFLELGHYFQNPAYYYVAEQAFAYENHHFNKKKNNWPDFRVNMYTEDTINAMIKVYENGNKQALTKPTDMNAWCHGAAGIGLARLRALQLLKNKTYAEDIEKARKKTKTSHLSSFTLCHGTCGNAELFIQNYLTQKNTIDLQEAQKIARLALKQKKTIGVYKSGLNYDTTKIPEDPSLFNGISGIGYFFLRVADPEHTPTVLAPLVPSIAESNAKNNTVTLASIKKQLIANIFPKTIQTLEQIGKDKLKAYFEADKKVENEITTFIAFVTTLFLTLPQDKQKILTVVFIHEVTKRKLLMSSKSNGLLFIKDRVEKTKAAQLLELTDKELVKRSFYLSPEVKLYIDGQDKKFLFKLTALGVEELEISLFCYVVLQAFKKYKTIDEVIKKMQKLYKPKSDSEREIITDKTVAQAKEAITYGILLTK